MLYLITTSPSCPEEWERCLFNISINRSKDQIHHPNQRIKLNPRLFLSLPYQTDNRDIIVKKSRVRTLERHGNYGKIPDLDHMVISTPYGYDCSWIYAHRIVPVASGFYSTCLQVTRFKPIVQNNLDSPLLPHYYFYFSKCSSTNVQTDCYDHLLAVTGTEIVLIAHSSG